MRAALTAGDSITVDRLMSTVSPFGTGMSSNSLRCTRGGVDAQAVAARRQSEMARTRRMASTSCASSYSRRGLLSRLQNESQLAMILGHEVTHVTNRHALKFNRDPRNKQIFFTMAGIAAALGVAVAPGQPPRQGYYVSAEVLRTTSNIFLGLGLQLAFIAAVNGFGRDLEREADREGLERMVAAGYDPREAPRVFELLRDDHGDGSRL